MAAADRQRADEALDWLRRIHDPSFAAWADHAAWLEADPRNLDAFDAASLTIAAATAGLAPPRPPAASPVAINDNAPDVASVPRRRARWGAGIGLAVAAGIATLVALPTTQRAGSPSYWLETHAGDRRTVVLDGTRIALNGDSRVRLDRSDPRHAVVERGEAFFAVRHDIARPFTVEAGGATFRDVGTAFDVVQRSGVIRLAVREGAVRYDGGGGAGVQIDAGRSIRIADGTAVLQPVDRATVGGWRTGRLSYRDAALAEVAEDVARSIGEPVAVDAAIAGRRFSGVVMIDADRARMFRRMAAVMGVAVRRDAAGWRMVTPAQ